MVIDWQAYFQAPLVLATMLPFWFLWTFIQGAVAGMSVRRAALFGAWYAPVATAVVWLLLFLPFGLAGVYRW